MDFVCGWAMKVVFLLVAISVGTTAYALDDAYKCTVVSAKQLGDTGEIVASGSGEIYIGSEFVIDRGSGKMIGPVPKNWGAFGQPQVLDPGSDVDGFKALTIYGPHVTVDLLVVESYAESSKKPFLFIDSNIFIISGVCMDY